MFNMLTYYLSFAQTCMMDSSVLTSPARSPVHACTISFHAGPSQKDCLTILDHLQVLTWGDNRELMLQSDGFEAAALICFFCRWMNLV